MISLPVEVLVGISFGILIGIVPAFAVGALGFGLSYYRDQQLPRAAVVALALPLAAVNGLLVGVVEVGAVRAPRFAVATLVVVILALYADSQGRALAADAPRDTDLRTVRERTLSASAIDSVDATGQVTISATGEVRDVDGHPPLEPGVRTALETGSWRLPSDLPLSELEGRLEDRLRTDYDLADVSVSIDARGRATIAAAPPSKGLARRVPKGWRAVSIRAALPTGLAPGDEVTVETTEGRATGVVLGAAADESGGARDGETGAPGNSDSAVHDATGALRRAVDATDGGPGRLTVAVPTADAGALLAADAGRVVVEPRGTRHDFEALSLLEDAGRVVRRVFVDRDVPSALAELDDVRVLGVRRDGSDDRLSGWSFDPDRAAPEPGSEAFVAGDASALERLADDPREPAVDGVGR